MNVLVMCGHPVYGMNICDHCVAERDGRHCGCGVKDEPVPIYGAPATPGEELRSMKVSHKRLWADVEDGLLDHDTFIRWLDLVEKGYEYSGPTDNPDDLPREVQFTKAAEKRRWATRQILKAFHDYHSSYTKRLERELNLAWSVVDSVRECMDRNLPPSVERAFKNYQEEDGE